MNENTSRIILTVALSIGILLAWSHFFAPKPQPKPTNAATSQKAGGGGGKSVAPGAASRAAGSTKGALASAPSSGPSSQATSRPAEGPRSMSVEGVHTELAWKGGQARITFSDQGATLRRVVLLNERYRELRGGKLQQVDLVQTEAGKGPWPLLTAFPESDFSVPSDAKFSLIERGAEKLVYRWSSAKVELTKSFTLDAKRPVVRMELRVRNKTKSKLKERLRLKLFARQDPQQAAPGMTNPYPKVPTVLCHLNNEIQRRSLGAANGTQSGCSAAGCGMGSGPVSGLGKVRWIASDDRYFMTAVIPRGVGGEAACELRMREGQHDVLESVITFPQATIDAGGEQKHRFTLLLGPKDLGALDGVKGEGQDDLQLSDAIEFGWFALLCRPMLALLQVSYGFLGNWGLAIIFLTLIVKLLTFYWTHKSMRSMRSMQRLKPEMDRLKEKYGDDKNRLNQEMMTLYRTHKVNPLGGCLPMLLQMPVWFALYRTLGNAQELYRSHFAGWITDLTAPDPYYVLPIAMGLSMFAQQAMTPQTLDGAQAKMMKYFMPVMFTFMMLWLPAGLTLYIFVNTVLSMAHQWHMNRTDPMPLTPPAKESAGGGEGAATSGRARRPSSGIEAGSRVGGPGAAARGKNRQRKKN